MAVGCCSGRAKGGSNQVCNALFMMSACCDSDALRTTRHYRVLDWDLKDDLFTAASPTIAAGNIFYYYTVLVDTARIV